MDENVWQCAQFLMWAFGIQTTILIAIIGAFYSNLNKKIEKNSVKIDAFHSDLLKRIETVNSDLQKKIDAFHSDLLKRMETVNSDLLKRIETVSSDLQKKIEVVNSDLLKKIDVVNSDLLKKIDSLDKNVQNMTTRMAVFESKLTDISTNVTHLMWHNQTYPFKELKEE